MGLKYDSYICLISSPFCLLLPLYTQSHRFLFYMTNICPHAFIRAFLVLSSDEMFFNLIGCNSLQNVYLLSIWGKLLLEFTYPHFHHLCPFTLTYYNIVLITIVYYTSRALAHCLCSPQRRV